MSLGIALVAERIERGLVFGGDSGPAVLGRGALAVPFVAARLVGLGRDHRGRRRSRTARPRGVGPRCPFEHAGLAEAAHPRWGTGERRDGGEGGWPLGADNPPRRSGSRGNGRSPTPRTATAKPVTKSAGSLWNAAPVHGAVAGRGGAGRRMGERAPGIDEHRRAHDEPLRLGLDRAGGGGDGLDRRRRNREDGASPRGAQGARALASMRGPRFSFANAATARARRRHPERDHRRLDRPLHLGRGREALAWIDRSRAQDDLRHDRGRCRSAPVRRRRPAPGRGSRRSPRRRRGDRSAAQGPSPTRTRRRSPPRRAARPPFESRDP